MAGSTWDAARRLHAGHTARLRVGLAATAAFPLTPRTALELLVIASEPRYVALSDRHPLASQPTVSFKEIADEPWIEVSESDPVWCAFWRLTDLRTEPPRVGASGRSLEDLLEAARTRQAIGVVPESVARSQPWPRLTFTKVIDIPPADVAIAWHAGRPSLAVREFIAIARELAIQP